MDDTFSEEFLAVERLAHEQRKHAEHYGGKDNPYEAIKVIEAWGLGFNLGNCLKYICRAGIKTPERKEDLRKALWYLEREIKHNYKRYKDASLE